jgi:hypothetical protein
MDIETTTLNELPNATTDIPEFMDEENMLLELSDEYITRKLITLPHRIYKQEARIIQQKEGIAEAKLNLQKKEAELLTSGVVDGKNKETRDAQLLNFTQDERDTLTELETLLQQQLIVLNFLNNLFSSYRAIARLRSKGD